MPEYRGQCHCGAVTFSFFDEEISQGIRCNCSLCVRKGALMSLTLFSKNALSIDDSSGLLSCYQFGSKVAKHYFCSCCGIYTFHETLRKPGYFRVNLGCLDGLDASALESDLFDGKHLL